MEQKELAKKLKVTELQLADKIKIMKRNLEIQEVNQMLNIQLDKKYRIVSDTSNYIIQAVGVVREGENKGKETITVSGYYGSLESALKAYKRLLIRESDITTVDELLRTLKEIDIKIENVLRGN